MSDCSICCETFNKSNRSKIRCKTCVSNEVVACQSCAKRYILEQPTDPSCMICKIEWDIEFLCDNFSKVFVNKELKKHREDFLIEKQLALLPETQGYAEELKRIEKLENIKQELLKKKKNLEIELRKINNNIRKIDQDIASIRYNSEDEKPKVEFSYKCPVDNCNGFLNEKFECGICDNKICRHCMEIKGEEHECDETKKETVKLLRQDTKPCPKCGELINKIIGGCDQMYCIKCHTAFSWKTGKLDRGTIHNPEYYRWMRENGKEIPRNPLDQIYDPCGNNLIDYTNLLFIMRTHFSIIEVKRGYKTIRTDAPETIKIANMHRMVCHINHLNTMFNHDTISDDRALRLLRANFILNKVTKDDFKKKLQMIEKKNNKNKKINNVWNVLRLVLIEYIGKMHEARQLPNKEFKTIINDILNESKKIRKYCNESHRNTGKMFKMVYPGINREWIQVNNWESYIKQQEKIAENIITEAARA